MLEIATDVCLFSFLLRENESDGGDLNCPR